MGTFKLIPQPIGSGWISLHVAVDEYMGWPETEGEIILTHDAENAAQVNLEIDDLIAERQALKSLAHQKFLGWGGHSVTPKNQ